MPERLPSALLEWARTAWPGGDPGPLAARPLVADGSPRLFARLEGGGRVLVALYSPDNPPENRAWLYMARHLGGLGLPVARVLAADPEGGCFLMEDLGPRSLQEHLAQAPPGEQARRLEPVLAMLAAMQAQAGRELDLGVCFDGPELTPRFLREREAGYFVREMVIGACGRQPGDLPPGLDQELDQLCRLAGQAHPRGFVHRDFQSRNILCHQGRLGLVDFQGGRLGPAQYDLAALVHDSYLDLDWSLREDLVERYLALRAPWGDFDQKAFRDGWPYVCLSRVMQALGAFAFLTRRRGRTHFAAYAVPGLATLRRLVAQPPLSAYPALAGLVAGLPARPLPRPLEEEA